MKLSSAAASILFATCGGVSTVFDPSSSFVTAKEHSPPPRLIVTSSNTTTDCPSTLDFVTRGDIKCDTVASMEWFLTTKEGIGSLQGLTKGLSLDQIQQPKGIKPNSGHHALAVSSVVGDEDEIRPLNSNNSKNKKSSSDKGGVPIVTPIPPFGGTVSSKCSPYYLKDPLIDCETIGSMLWFLTTDEGIASLQGMVDGMKAERIVQRHAIISIFKDFNMMAKNGKMRENRELGISIAFNECDMDEITCNNSGKITKIELNGRGLSGTVSLDVVKLRKSLQVLDLGSNSFSGKIPAQIASLKKLKYLDLSHNAFTGSVPANLKKLRNLITMNLAGNNLSGAIPSWLQKLRKLKFLYLHENNFAGSFPTGVCLPIQAKSGTVSSDCFGAPPKINCELFTCCNLCYPLSWHQIGADIDGGAVNVFSGYSVSLSSDGSRMAIGAPGNSLNNASYSGRVRVYEWNADILPPSWQQVGDVIDGEAAGDEFGVSVSLSGDGTILAIGAKSNDNANGNDSGHVRVYEWNAGGSWQQQGAAIDGEAANDYSGSSVSLSSDGTVLAIGAYGNSENGNFSGHVRVYEWNGSSWQRKGTTDIDGEAAADQFGSSVSLSSDGTVLAIGAPGSNGANGNFSGHVHVYKWNAGGSWQQQGAAIDGEAAYDGSGYSVSLSSDGTILAIGAYGNDGNGEDSGNVRVYEWDGIAWNQRGTDIYGEVAYDYSGHSVSLSGDGTVVAIGAWGNDGNAGADSGHVRVYEWNAGTSDWDQMGDDIDGEAAGDKSGYSVSLSSDGTTVAIGCDVVNQVRVFKY